MDAKLMTALCFFFTASPVVAEEVLYCVDTEMTGFSWDNNGKAMSNKFTAERHTIKIVSDTKRLITRHQGDTAGETHAYECTQYKTEVVCQEAVLPLSAWHFYRDGYTRAYLYGGPPPIKRDPNIFIAYGTCTKF